MIDAARWYVEQGLVQIYCPDSLDAESWYNRSIHPADRVRTHMAYENLILNDIVQKVRFNTPTGKVAMAGASFGGFHAANFAFRHPGLVAYMFSMSGAFDIVQQQLDGYYDENCYYNSPPDFLPELNDGNLWQMGIVLGTAEHDICKDQNIILSGILSRKNVNHWLDIRPGSHDWPIWLEMFPHYLSRMDFG